MNFYSVKASNQKTYFFCLKLASTTGNHGSLYTTCPMPRCPIALEYARRRLRLFVCAYPKRSYEPRPFDRAKFKFIDFVKYRGSLKRKVKETISIEVTFWFIHFNAIKRKSKLTC